MRLDVHQSSMQAMQRFVGDHLSTYRGRKARILDVGSMDVNGSYRTLLDDPLWEYTGMDAEQGNGVDIVLRSPYDWGGLGSESYDIVVSGQAFEHIEFPWVTIVEITRVLKPGGILCVIVPSSGYQHRYPLDCWRYYPDGIRALARWADLDVISAETNWDPHGDFIDDSAVWKDTVLVARKPGTPARLNIKARTKQVILRRISAFQANRRQSFGAVPS